MDFAKCINKKILFKAIIISVLISTVFMIIFISWLNNPVSISDFTIGTLNLETEEYSSWVSYKGSATITCTDTDTDYLVLVKITDTANETTDYSYYLVHDGTGTITTYDSTYSEDITKPNYTFQVIGWRNFKSN